MEFLVEIDVHWPPEADPKRRDALIQEEVARAAQLASAGKLKRLWRVPGRWANIGLWEASDATELHALLAALPFYPCSTSSSDRWRVTGPIRERSSDSASTLSVKF